MLILIWLIVCIIFPLLSAIALFEIQEIKNKIKLMK
jgi:hypothetical protein